jgi:hypothetical protein
MAGWAASIPVVTIGRSPLSSPKRLCGLSASVSCDAVLVVTAFPSYRGDTSLLAVRWHSRAFATVDSGCQC